MDPVNPRNNVASTLTKEEWQGVAEFAKRGDGVFFNLNVALQI